MIKPPRNKRRQPPQKIFLQGIDNLLVGGYTVHNEPTNRLPATIVAEGEKKNNEKNKSKGGMAVKEARRYSREQVKQYAHDAALELYNRMNFEQFSGDERETLLAIAESFFRKWFNGRSETLMSPDYLIAEAADEVFERHDNHSLELAAAVAALCFKFYEERIQPELTEALK